MPKGFFFSPRIGITHDKHGKSFSNQQIFKKNTAEILLPRTLT